MSLDLDAEDPYEQAYQTFGGLSQGLLWRKDAIRRDLEDHKLPARVQGPPFFDSEANPLDRPIRQGDRQPARKGDWLVFGKERIPPFQKDTSSQDGAWCQMCQNKARVNAANPGWETKIPRL